MQGQQLRLEAGLEPGDPRLDGAPEATTDTGSTRIEPLNGVTPLGSPGSSPAQGAPLPILYNLSRIASATSFAFTPTSPSGPTHDGHPDSHEQPAINSRVRATRSSCI